jgi:hypothetical protein
MWWYKPVQMKNIYCLVALILLSGSCLHAQDAAEEYKEPSKESMEYNGFRQFKYAPPYGLRKVMKLVEKMKTDENDQKKLLQRDYQALSLREKFTYHMIHAESFSQNCDVMPPIQDEHKKIFGHLPDDFGEYAWSERQINFFKNNKDSVIKLMKECIAMEKRIGLNFKHAIVQMNATELIPFLISTYKAASKKDHDILTVLMLFMKRNRYASFLSSASNKKLYGDESGFQSFILYNTANEDLIIKRATDFYNGLAH